MAQIANIAYFFLYCNKVLGTNYTGYNSSLEAINLYWTTKMVQKVYNDIHQPKPGCRHLLSAEFNLSESAGLTVVDITFIHTVVNYLSTLNKVCDVECPCPCSYITCPPDNCVNCKNCGVCHTTTCSHCCIIYFGHCATCSGTCSTNCSQNCSKYQHCQHCWQYCTGWVLILSPSQQHNVGDCVPNLNSNCNPCADCKINCNGDCPD
jgi:hypothetical protein